MAEFDISKLPRWIFAFAALIVSISAGYGMFYASCTTELFGLSFGKSRPCENVNSDLEMRVEALEGENVALRTIVEDLGTRDRGSVELTITNQGRGDKEGCPIGSFVSAISAPGGVGGKYATDGINKISYKCSPLASE